MDINEILQLIETTKIEQTKEVWCPSLNRNIKILPLNASHQKDIIKSLMDNPTFNSNFNISIYEILKNVVNEDIDNFTILDKKFLLLALRCYNINKFYKKIDLEKFISEKSETIKHPEDISKIIDDSYEVKIGLPTLKTEFEFETFVNNNLQTLNKNDKNIVKQILSHIFIINIISYIKELKIKDNLIPFESLDINEKLIIGSNLPSKLINFIINELDTNYGKVLNQVISFKETGSKQIEKIKIDGSFFLS